MSADVDAKTIEYIKQNKPMWFATKVERETWMVDHFFPKDIEQQLEKATELVKDVKIDYILSPIPDHRMDYICLSTPVPVGEIGDNMDWISFVYKRMVPMVKIRAFNYIDSRANPSAGYNILIEHHFEKKSLLGDNKRFLVVYAFIYPK